MKFDLLHELKSVVHELVSVHKRPTSEVHEIKTILT